MVSRLHRAIEAREFVLRFQPVVDLGSGRIHGAEALIRWQPPGGDLDSAGRLHSRWPSAAG